MHSLSSFVSLAAVGIIVLAGTASAQPRPLYVTDGSGPSTRYAIQGGVVTNSFGPSGGCDYGIAVSSGKVSTLQTITGCGSAGNQYTLGGTLIGPAAVNNSPVDYFYDGASDGTYNYTVGFYGKTVYRAGLDWSNLTPLFNASPTGVNVMTGITWDAQRNSLWLGEYECSTCGLFEYSMAGNLLSSFTNITYGRGISALAFDATSQSLWYSDNGPSATLFEVDRSGNQLSQFNVSGTMAYFTGAEFETVSTVPEPSSLVLLSSAGLGLAAAARWRRSR